MLSVIKTLALRLQNPTVTLESASLSPGNNRMKVERLWTMRGQARPDLAAMQVYFMAEAGYLDAVPGLATA